MGTGLLVLLLAAQIPKPTDAPPPLPPEESARRVTLPPGFRLELAAAEPLVREPSGLCFDERGRLLVCELHGYNLEGQYDIDELNKTGQLDRVVRRLQADEKARQAAEAGTYGTVKLLTDTNGDGRMDRAEVWADRLPPCYGLCPARGGVIVACAPDIVYLADRDGDGKAEVREVLFTGFAHGALERGINNPQWGPDGWITVGGGHGGGTITGPRLARPVKLPATDFRIRADGSAIEPITGRTETIGFAFTPGGDRFVISTRTPGIQVAPIDWLALARNPEYAAPSLQRNAAGTATVFPTSKPHPWRTRRSDDPGFSKYYTDHYGREESAPNGYFTSACSPLVYQDAALPGLRGQLFACEPAQNLIHRALIERDGAALRLKRAPGEEQSEFLASSDPWFHPMALSHGPDGAIWIVDFYREIIEDYSAIPRYLQQQYGLVNGKDHGRIWRLTHADAPAAPPPDMKALSTERLVAEVASPYSWRRQTAGRLLVERGTAPGLARIAASDPYVVLAAVTTLKALGEPLPESLRNHPDPEVRRHLPSATDPEPIVRLHAALAGEDLVTLAREHGDELWMAPAILSAPSDRALGLLRELVRDPGKGGGLLEPLGAIIGARRRGPEISEALVLIDAHPACLKGLKAGIGRNVAITLSDAAREALKTMSVRSPDARSLAALLKIESDAERRARLSKASAAVTDGRLPVEERLAAVAQLAAEDDSSLLVEAYPSGTPRIREAIVGALTARSDRFGALLDAVERKALPASAFGAVQRAALLQHPRAAALLRSPDPPNLGLYAAALKGARDPARGQVVFAERCAKCHAAHGIGSAVGPDLSAEFQRAEETLLRDLLAPSETLSPGYATVAVTTADGDVFTGLLAMESPTSLTVRMAEAKEQTVLRKDVAEFRILDISLMPEDLVKDLTPRDVADLLAWLRRPPASRVLLDDNRELAAALTEGAGTAEFVISDKHSGEASLRVTPPQRFSPRLPDWAFPIRETGGYRYLRFAWKSDGGHGVMLELAADGAWPPADKPLRRYFAGRNTTGWGALEVSADVPRGWTVVTRDVWKDFGDFTLTGLAPTAMGGPALFDRVELLQEVPP